ncbi:MAG TPA: NAD(P)-binding domain-containing protein [Steroidobacteraceae bacterium]|jgi:thioredoxin reductase (NADPH)|nr:NAD(P)-binding domain-containing protein [Steroidobacteraceae bacterium]
MSAWTWLVYLIPLVLAWTWQVTRRRTVASKGRDAHIQAQRTGLNEPVSLHPTINALCVGCSECVKACPEKEFNVLGMIDGKAELINAGDCIGHGACRTSCPVNAISLVFGTAKRGIDIPILTPEFETNVPGIFVAGELGGMGLIRNALVQGTQAVEAIARRRQRRQGMVDVLIVGAGPAGFAASLTAMSLGLKYVTLEQESLGGCVFQYPRAKLVMTSPVEVPIIGKLKITQTSKEELLEFWRNVEKKTGVAIKYRERVESITPRGGGFLVRTAMGQYAAASVLLAIGRRGTPRKLGVPGEDLSKVVYRLVDPEQYSGQRVLVVGGGDSALEAASSIAESTNAKVALSYRGDAFVRAKVRNRERLESARKTGRLHIVLKSQVRQIAPDAVVVEQSGKLMRIPNEVVIVAAGGIVPTDFLKNVGVQVQTKYGTA